MNEIQVGVARIEDGRSVGQRQMSLGMLDKLQTYLDRTGEGVAAHCVLGWLDPDNFERPTDEELQETLARLRAREADLRDPAKFLTSGARRGQRLKEAIYCEAAVFCVEACLGNQQP